MNQPRKTNWDKVKPYGDFEQLPKGGYVLKILDIEEKQNRNGGKYFEISADIFEGDYARYFEKEFKERPGEDKKWKCRYFLNEPVDDGSDQDTYRLRALRTFTDALEDSNPGYTWDWDETRWKGKLIGGLFNAREWEFNGKTGWSTRWKSVCSVEKIKTGTYKLPADEPLKSNIGTAPTTASNDFMQLPEGSEEELPFA